MSYFARPLRCAIAALLAAAPAAQAEGGHTANIAVTSDYVFRGLSQSWGRPALQGGYDIALDNGVAAGAWASSLSDRSYPGAAAELDLYASYGRRIASDWTWRVGVYAYVYPGGNLDEARPALPSRSFDTVEANAALGWRWLTLKWNRSVGDYFGIDREQGYRSDSRGTRYVQLDASLPLSEVWTLALHAGRTQIPTRLASPLVSGASDPSYHDVGAMLKQQFAARWSWSLGLSRASNAAFYARTAAFNDPSESKDIGGTRVFALVQGTF